MNPKYLEYATVTAQIIPVLMLALIVEWRAQARWMTRGERIQARWLRWTAGVALILASVALFMALGTALNGIRRGGLSEFERFVVGTSTLVGAGAIFYLPAFSLALALLSDVPTALYVRFPFAAPARRARELARDARIAAEYEREDRVYRLEARSALAGAYIRLYQQIPAASMDALPFRRKESLSQYMRELDDVRVTIDGMRERMEAGVSGLSAERERVRKIIEENWKDVSVVRQSMHNPLI